ncbi:MAG: glycine cleavage system protein GcvH [Candidatus Methylumidiphilus sp.]
MSNTPENLKYAKTHEWADLGQDGRVRVGITDFAQAQLGDVVFIELPKVGQPVTADKACATIESVKAASDINSPVSGVIAEVNSAVADAPELVNADSYAHWLFTVTPSNPDEIADLLDAAAYLDSTV